MAGRRPLRGGVDRNPRPKRRPAGRARRPLRGGVDRNTIPFATFGRTARRPLRGGVDRNEPFDVRKLSGRVAPFAGAWIETP